ncbi:MAG: SpoIID/LytB domain-containing protein [Vallitaleaceae bacterium]|jgi:stage II sporulation protein D|nr:SpoIID/LytB domain-containing protein [Vallitaleaceae bacterium]
MKRKTLIITLIMILLFNMTSSISIGQGFAYSEEIRVGLKYYFEEVPSLTLDNKSLLMGYIVGGQFVAEYEAVTTGKFYFEPATNRFLISVESFGTFDEAHNQLDRIRTLGYNAYVGSVATGIWKVYAGNVSTESEINQIYNQINGVFGMTFESVTDNGLRTIVYYDGDYPMVFENSYSNIQFFTNDTRSGVPVLDLGKRSYRGRIEIGRYYNGGLTAINVVDMEDYLYGVLPSEMPTGWPIEALKAQAVAARNYAVYYTSVNPKYRDKPYQIDDTVNSQVYKGYAIEELAANQAIDSTAGVLIYYNDAVIPSYFFSTSGGHTESSENVWTGTVAYLKGVPDLYETDPYKEPWTTSFTSSSFNAVLNSKGVYIGDIESVNVTAYTDSERAQAITIKGSLASYTIEKETMRYWFGLYSRKFEIVQPGSSPNTSMQVMGADGTLATVDIKNAYVINGSGEVLQANIGDDQTLIMSANNIHSVPLIYGENGKFIFVGQGYGHGIGMSQSGAKGMAAAGFTYDEILEYYYTGVEVR